MTRKRRKRRTRAELEGVERQPNGQPSRRRGRYYKAPAQTMDDVAKQARQRFYLVATEDCGDPLAGSVQGRLCLSGHISRAQYDAAEKYLEKYHVAMAFLEPPKGLQVSSRSGRPVDWDAPEFDRLEFTDKAIRATAEFRVACQAVVDADPTRHAAVALNLMVVQQVDCVDNPAFVDALKVALRALVRKFGIAA